MFIHCKPVLESEFWGVQSVGFGVCRLRFGVSGLGFGE